MPMDPAIDNVFPKGVHRDFHLFAVKNYGACYPAHLLLGSGVFWECCLFSRLDVRKVRGENCAVLIMRGAVRLGQAVCAYPLSLVGMFAAAPQALFLWSH